MKYVYRAQIERLPGRWFGTINHFVDDTLIKQVTTTTPPWELSMDCPDCGRPLEVKRSSRRGEVYEFTLACKGPHNQGRVGPKEGDDFATGGVVPKGSYAQPEHGHGERTADPRVQRGS